MTTLPVTLINNKIDANKQILKLLWPTMHLTTCYITGTKICVEYYVTERIILTLRRKYFIEKKVMFLEWKSVVLESTMTETR